MRETEHIFAEGIADGLIKPMKRDYVVGDALDDFIQGLNDAPPIRSAVLVQTLGHAARR